MLDFFLFLQNGFSEFKAAHLPHMYIIYVTLLTVQAAFLSSASFPPCLISAWLKMRNVLVEFILSFF